MFQLKVYIVKTPTIGIKTELVYATKTELCLREGKNYHALFTLSSQYQIITGMGGELEECTRKQWRMQNFFSRGSTLYF